MSLHACIYVPDSRRPEELGTWLTQNASHLGLEAVSRIGGRWRAQVSDRGHQTHIWLSCINSGAENSPEEIQQFAAFLGGRPTEQLVFTIHSSTPADERNLLRFAAVVAEALGGAVDAEELFDTYLNKEIASAEQEDGLAMIAVEDEGFRPCRYPIVRGGWLRRALQAVSGD